MAITLKFTITTNHKVVFTSEEVKVYEEEFKGLASNQSPANQLQEHLIEVYQKGGIEEALKAVTRYVLRNELKSFWEEKKVTTSPAKVTFHD